MWTKNCILIEHYNNRTGVNFMNTSTKFYVPVVILSISNNIEFLKKIETRIQNERYYVTNIDLK